jgi:hypothetical protein
MRPAAAGICRSASRTGVERAGVIDIEFAGGARMRITGAIDPAVLAAAITDRRQAARMIPVRAGARP